MGKRISCSDCQEQMRDTHTIEAVVSSAVGVAVTHAEVSSRKQDAVEEISEIQKVSGECGPPASTGTELGEGVANASVTDH